MEIVKNKQQYELVINKNASREEYEVVLNYLINKLQLKKGEVKETDDFDSFFHLFTYKGNNISLHYSNFLGISIYIHEENIKADIQEKVLKEFSEILSKVPL